MPSKELMSVSIIVPVYNERESIAELIAQCEHAFAAWKREYVFVDDGSTDGSYEELKTQCDKNVSGASMLVRLRKNCGKAAALSVGFKHATGDVFVTLDADLQDDPAEAARLAGHLSKEVDMIVGWRKKRSDTGGKLGVSFIFNRVVSRFTGLSLHDMNSGLKVMKRDVGKEIRLYGDLHRFIPVLAHVRGFSVREMPVTHHARKYGSSKFGPERIFAAFDLLTTLFLSGYSSRPSMMFGPPGLVLATVGTVVLVYLSALHFSGESIGTRPLLLMGVMFVLFGLQLLSTGLLGELMVSARDTTGDVPIAEVHGL